MTTNKPEVVAYLHTNKENPDHRGVSLYHDSSCTSTLTNTEPLIRLSDYEKLAQQQSAQSETAAPIRAESVESYPAYKVVDAVCKYFDVDGETATQMIIQAAAELQTEEKQHELGQRKSLGRQRKRK